MNDAESLLRELPLEMRELPPATKDVKPRLAALARLERASTLDAPTRRA